ncbi:MAG TPA: DNA-3-methyladenine glycosylase [Anseongella sp.]|nr:DNA-3-methyladenine glycosylase [Anseongella sp.]
MKLPEEFYQRDDVVGISRELLGKFLFTNLEGGLTGGMIVETEAYHGREDRASHAWNGRFTERTKVMYAPGGHAYVYLCYGIHYLFNVVTGGENTPHAVLVRAVKPVEGIDIQLRRRNMTVLHPRIAAGPGSVSKALGIDKALNGESLNGDRVWIEDRGIIIESNTILAGPRVGVDYAGEHALLPWRFRIDEKKTK